MVHHFNQGNYLKVVFILDSSIQIWIKVYIMNAECFQYSLHDAFSLLNLNLTQYSINVLNMCLKYMLNFF